MYLLCLKPFIIPTTSAQLIGHGFVTDACENIKNRALCCAAVYMQPVLIVAHNILIFCQALIVSLANVQRLKGLYNRFKNVFSMFITYLKF